VVESRKGTEPILEMERSPAIFRADKKDFVKFEERRCLLPRVLKREDRRCVSHTGLHRKLSEVFSFGKTGSGRVLI
tara:strand:+ start:445 stop:672 length:228 start_codon:yes stop_codon:yes gene_type:complete